MIVSTPHGNLLWIFKTGGWVKVLAIGKGYIVAGSNSIYCIDMNGNLLWSYTTENDVTTVSIDSNYIVAGGLDHYVYCFDFLYKFKMKIDKIKNLIPKLELLG